MNRPRPTLRSAAAALVAVATLAAGLVLSAPPASAGVRHFVELVTYRDALDTCLPGQALPCTPNAGVGQSNVLRIVQVPGSGGLEFGSYETTAKANDRLWLAATLSARCKPTRRLDAASVHLGYRNTAGSVGVPVQIDSEWSTGVSVPDARSMQKKTLALNPRVGDVFNDASTPHVAGFATIEDVFAHGESVVAARIAGGMNEAKARSLPFHVDTTVATKARVWCRNLQDTKSSWRERGRYLPLRIQFVPVAVPTVDRPTVDDIDTKPRVTRVDLDVQPDPFDPCRLRLYGEIETTRATTVRYRFIGPDGSRSNVFKRRVGPSGIGYISRQAVIPMAPVSEPVDDLVAPPGPIGDLISEADQVPSFTEYSGTYVLQVLKPSRARAVDSFTVPHCPPSAPDVGGTM
jgi:hypothetical protein